MQSKQLDYLTNVLRFRQMLGGINILKTLYMFSVKDWERYTNAETGDHLIRDELTSGQKTDSVNSYINKLVKLYLNSIGSQPSTWTKNTLTAENTLTKAVIGRLAVARYADNDELFRAVVSRIIGVDLSLIDAALAPADDFAAQAKTIVQYLYNITDLTADVDGAADDTYSDFIIVLTGLLKFGHVGEELFALLVDESFDDELEGLDLVEVRLCYIVGSFVPFVEAYNWIEVERQKVIDEMTTQLAEAEAAKAFVEQ